MARNRPLHDFGLAVTLLTAVPVPVRVQDGGRNQSASYFALVGLVLGGVLLGVVWVANRYFYGLSGVAAALVLLSYALATRLLHWDGLADVADGWFVTPERRLAVMSDSAVGAFGATAIAFAALLQWAALGELSALATTVAPVVMVPVFGRLAATFSAWLGKPAKPDGLGRTVMGRPSALGVAVTAVSVALAVWVAYALGTPVLVLTIASVVGLVAALVVPHLVAGRFGGVTGDTMGASVLLVESVMLVAILLVSGVLRLLGLSA